MLQIYFLRMHYFNAKYGVGTVSMIPFFLGVIFQGGIFPLIHNLETKKEKNANLI